MSPERLRAALERALQEPSPDRETVLPLLDELLKGLESGRFRAAECGPDGWRVNRWVKQGILLGFRIGSNVSIPVSGVFHFRDRDTFPTQDPAADGRDVRVVPGGSSVRRGAYLGGGVVVMPPAYINVGAYVGEESMVDSHALVGSCAQIGARVHLSAAAQVGGVLEPIGALPVIVEDDVFIGGGCGIYEGTRVERGAVLAPGVVLTKAVPVYDLARSRVHRASSDQPLVIPPNAVVVPGTRPAGGAFAHENGIQLQTPVIVKYRDDSTDASLALEEALR